MKLSTLPAEVYRAPRAPKSTVSFVERLITESAFRDGCDNAQAFEFLSENGDIDRDVRDFVMWEGNFVSHLHWKAVKHTSTAIFPRQLYNFPSELPQETLEGFSRLQSLKANIPRNCVC